jgi:hypothetical protein
MEKEKVESGILEAEEGSINTALGYVLLVSQIRQYLLR